MQEIRRRSAFGAAEEKDSYDVYLARSQGSDYVTWNDHLASTASYEEEGYGYHASGRGDRAGVRGEVWMRLNAAAYEVGENGTSNVT